MTDAFNFLWAAKVNIRENVTVFSIILQRREKALKRAC